MQEKRYRATVPALIQCWIEAGDEAEATEKAQDRFKEFEREIGGMEGAINIKLSQTEVIREIDERDD